MSGFLNNFNIHSIKLNTNSIIIGQEKTGKSNVIFLLINLFIQKYNVKVYICSNKEAEYNQLIPKENYYLDCKKMLNIIIEQQDKLKEENEKNFYKGKEPVKTNILVVLDDVVNDEIFKTINYNKIFTDNNITTIIAAKDIHYIPNLSVINYSFLLQNDNEYEIKNIYHKYVTFISNIISEELFISMFNSYTENYKAIIIKNKNLKFKIRYFIPCLYKIKPIEIKLLKLQLGNITLILNKSENKDKLLLQLYDNYKNKISNCIVCSDNPTFKGLIPSDNIYKDYTKICEDVINNQSKILDENEKLKKEKLPLNNKNILVIFDKKIDDLYTLSKNVNFQNIIYNGRNYGITLIICADVIYNVPKVIFTKLNQLLLFNDEKFININTSIKDLYKYLLKIYPSEYIIKLILDKYINDNKVLYLDYNYNMSNNLYFIYRNCCYQIK